MPQSAVVLQSTVAAVVDDAAVAVVATVSDV